MTGIAWLITFLDTRLDEGERTTRLAAISLTCSRGRRPLIGSYEKILTMLPNPSTMQMRKTTSPQLGRNYRKRGPRS